MSTGTHRLFRYRMEHPGDDAFQPATGDFMVSVPARLRGTDVDLRTLTTYRILRAVLYRDAVEPWDDGGHGDPDAGESMRVVHFRVSCIRVDPAERPEDAMTWRMMPDRRRSHRPALLPSPPTDRSSEGVQ